jgi:hypothetical protein
MHRRDYPMRLFAVAMLILALMLGACGKESKDEKTAEKDFRIPDSLLSPLDRFKLTRDDYHPIDGGVMANAEIELHYPPGDIARYVAVKSFGAARDAYAKVRNAIGAPAEGRVYIIGAKDLDEYLFLTRKEWWYYGVVRGDTIYFEPLDVMLKRTILETGMAQKIAQVALNRRSAGRIPYWLKEGLASHVADEGVMLRYQIVQFRKEGIYDMNPSPEEIEKTLEEAYDMPSTRIAFYNAYLMTQNLLSMSDMGSAIEFIDHLGEGKDLDTASREVYGMDYSSLLKSVRVETKKE